LGRQGTDDVAPEAVVLWPSVQQEDRVAFPRLRNMEPCPARFHVSMGSPIDLGRYAMVVFLTHAVARQLYQVAGGSRAR
jgi:hypothetical protein